MVSGVKASIFDSPGLQDDRADDQHHIEKIKDVFAIHGEPDIVLYCIKIDDERLRREDTEAI